MKIKKPSMKGMKNCGYLGHFAKEKYLCQGHNFSGKMDLTKGDMGMSKDQPDYVVEITKPMEVGISAEKRAQIDAQIRRDIKNKMAIEKMKESLADQEDRDRRLAPELERRMRMRAKMKQGGDY